jgi:hypothetical protein
VALRRHGWPLCARIPGVAHLDRSHKTWSTTGVKFTRASFPEDDQGFFCPYFRSRAQEADVVTTRPEATRTTRLDARGARTAQDFLDRNRRWSPEEYAHAVAAKEGANGRRCQAGQTKPGRSSGGEQIVEERSLPGGHSWADPHLQSGVAPWSTRRVRGPSRQRIAGAWMAAFVLPATPSLTNLEKANEVMVL